ncbi:MAG: hypothetical protein COV76_06985, partial [Candidatus Omnitrophica bacterium CG11_big_fil_rev_8_21_14_0_20_64_10]
MILPSVEEFRSLLDRFPSVPVAKRLPLTRSPRALLEAAGWEAPAVLLESARTHPVTGRFSILAGAPETTLTARGWRPENPFAQITRWLADRRAPQLPGFPPFVGGVIAAIGYDAYRYFGDPFRFDPSASTRSGLPDLAAAFFEEAAVVDHQEKVLWVIALSRPGLAPEAAHREGIERVERLAARLAGEGPAAEPSAGPVAFEATHSRAAFREMVGLAQEAIAAGEIYQANLSQRFTASWSGSPWALYNRLTGINPSPFAAFADFGSFQIVSASPERLLRAADGWAQTRPIAGTRRRGRDAAEQTRLRQELLLNEKERAEHLMLVDLERNDLGRICRYGSVAVDELMGLEEYSHVTHIVSNVVGELREGVGLTEMVRALFPGGTITGCPKVRCLEIIEQLEPVRRGFYTGSLGYASASGPMDLNLLIRTALVTAGRVEIQAGAGIVA